MWQTKVFTETLSVLILAPNLWSLNRGSDLRLACTPVFEVGVQNPWPKNHTRTLSSPYESNKIKFKPDSHCFYDPFVQVCVHEQWLNKLCTHTDTRTCTRTHTHTHTQTDTHTHKENIVMSVWVTSISKCAYVSYYVCEFD